MSVAATPRQPPQAPATAAPDRRGLLLLASGHFVVDMTVGALPVLLPLFAATFDLTDLGTAMILGASTFASALVQPVSGLLADRRPAPWLLWGGVALATVGFVLSGVVGAYPALLACVLGSGVGAAAYHPEAARVVPMLAGPRKATGMAWFMTGGNLGFALGPLLAALMIPVLDARATLAFVVPGAAVTVLLVARRARLATPSPPRAEALAAGGGRHIPGFSLLVAVTSLRTWIQFGLLALGPLMLKEERGWTDQEAGLAVFGFTAAGVLGTIVGAVAADRSSGRRLLAWTLPLAAPLVAGFVLVGGAGGAALLAACGFVVMASMSVTVVMGQEYLPHRPALAAGVMIGFASIGSATPGLAVLGMVSDLAGRDAALWTIAALPLLAGALAAALPPPRRA